MGLAALPLIAQIGIGVSVAATGYSAVQQRKAGKAAGRAAEKERQIQDLQQARERRRQVREARIVRANMQQEAASGGVSSSSGATAGINDIGRQLSGNLNFLDTVGSMSREASVFNQRASNYQTKAATAESFGQIAQSAGSLFASMPQSGITDSNRYATIAARSASGVTGGR